MSKSAGEPLYDQLRTAFEADMAAAGWRPVFSIHQMVYAWECIHDTRRVVDDDVAFKHWQVTFSTPAQVFPASVDRVLGDEEK